MKKLSEAIELARRAEIAWFRKAVTDNLLENGWWSLLKRTEILSEKQTVRLSELMKLDLSTIQACLLREDFQRFWTSTNTGVRARCAHVWSQ